MKTTMNILFEAIKSLPKSDLDRITHFVMGIVSSNLLMPDRPQCPYCQSSNVIKYGHANGKQRFFCHGCKKTFLHTTGTLMANSHFSRSVWVDFIQDTLSGEALDHSTKKFKFSHQTAFNMRHKVLMALQDMVKNTPVHFSDIIELDETYVLESYKGKKLPSDVNRKPRKHGAKAKKRGLSNEYIAICTGIQRNGKAIAETNNRAKPSSLELCKIFGAHIAENTLVLTDGLLSYNSLESATGCTVVDINQQKGKKLFNLNLVNSFHSFIKEIYTHYHGVATKYINRYNVLFSIAFRCAEGLATVLFNSLCNIGTARYWHSVHDVLTYQLVEL